jgi:hypothetical protein
MVLISYRRGVGVGLEKRCHYFNRRTLANGDDQGQTSYRICSLCPVRGVKDDGQCSLPICSQQWDDQAFWMPFTSSQRLHAAGFNDVLIYRCLWIDCARLCLLFSIGCVVVLAYRPLTAVAL